MTKEELIEQLEKHVRKLKIERARLLEQYGTYAIAIHKANYFWKEIRVLEELIKEAKEDDSK